MQSTGIGRQSRMLNDKIWVVSLEAHGAGWLTSGASAAHSPVSPRSTSCTSATCCGDATPLLASAASTDSWYRQSIGHRVQRRAFGSATKKRLC